MFNHTCSLHTCVCAGSRRRRVCLSSFPRKGIASLLGVSQVTLFRSGSVPNNHILQEFYTLFLTRFRTYKIASPPQTKMTSKDDIKGLVSLKFLHPWVSKLSEKCVSIGSAPVCYGSSLGLNPDASQKFRIGDIFKWVLNLSAGSFLKPMPASESEALGEYLRGELITRGPGGQEVATPRGNLFR